jgi:hypothetical protein
MRFAGSCAVGAALLVGCSSRSDSAKAIGAGRSGGAGARDAGTGGLGAGGTGVLFVPDATAHCPLIACGSGLSLEAPLPVPFAELSKLSLTACQNARCFSATLGTLDQPPSGDTYASFQFPDISTSNATQSPHVQIIVMPRGTGFRLRINYDLWSGDDVHDGDRFTVTFEDASGRVRASFARTVMLDTTPSHDPCAYPCHGAGYDLPDGGWTDAGSP